MEKIYYSEALTCSIGRFNFKKHQLKLTKKEDIEEFETNLKELSFSARNLIRTISLDAANKLAAQHKAQAHQGALGSDAGPERQPMAQTQTAHDLIRQGMDPEQASNAAQNANPDNANEDFMPLEDNSLASLVNK